MKPVQTIRCKSFKLSRVHQLEQDGSWIISYQGHQINRQKKNYNTQGFLFLFFLFFLDDGVWERSHRQCGRLFSFFRTSSACLRCVGPRRTAMSVRAARRGGGRGGQSPPSHHVLVRAAVIGRVGVPAVLEVVAQHVVPVVLLL